MGWGSGSWLADQVWDAYETAAKSSPEDAERVFAELVANAFGSMDCDTLEECDNPIGDADNRFTLESTGAPVRPEVGTKFTDRYKETYVFNGKRWEYAD